MPDKPLEQACDARVCIHTDQILDSCMDKDCVEDLRVYLTRESQAALDRSTGAKTRCAELLFARVEVEPVSYIHLRAHETIGHLVCRLLL